MEEISALVTQFRNAIDIAREKGDFSKDICFREFPRACCGDTSDLLAHYLLQNGIQTDYVCGNYYGDPEGGWQSHAWLELKNGIIIDITGDQFKYNELLLNYDIPVYIGEMDEFHALFEVEERDVRKAVTIDKLGDFTYPRLKRLYDIIIDCMI